MMKKIFYPFSLLAVLTIIFVACEKDYNKSETNTPPPPQTASWKEGFSDFSKLGARGWVITNNSDRPGPEAWRRGRFESTNKYTFGLDYVVGFPAYSAERSQNDFISVDMYAGHAVANMSVWLFTPVTKMKNGDQLTFWSRAHIDDGSFASKDGTDRMEVRLNKTNVGTNVGADWTSVGDYSTLLTAINPNLTFGGYPEVWTKYTITLSGITGTINGRFAFRYFVSGGGPDGNNAGMVGVDEVEFISK